MKTTDPRGKLLISSYGINPIKVYPILVFLLLVAFAIGAVLPNDFLADMYARAMDPELRELWGQLFSILFALFIGFVAVFGVIETIKYHIKKRTAKTKVFVYEYSVEGIGGDKEMTTFTPFSLKYDCVISAVMTEKDLLSINTVDGLYVVSAKNAESVAKKINGRLCQNLKKDSFE